MRGSFPYTPHLHTCTASSIITILHQSGTFAINDEPTLTHHHYPKSIIYIRVHPRCCIFCELDKCIITYIHYYSIIQSIYTALKIFCAPPIHSSFPLPLLTTDHFTVSIVLLLPKCHIDEIIKYVAFQTGFFH